MKKLILKQEGDGSLIPNQTLVVTLYINRLDVVHRIIKAYNTDILARKLAREQPNSKILRYNEKAYVPELCIRDIIGDYHDDLIHGHPGVAKTIELIGREYAAPGLRTSVERYIKECI